MAEEQEKQEEEKFDFTREGEVLGYISLDQARVLAMRTAGKDPGDYGRRFRNTTMAFEVVEDSETEDHYVVILSFRPQGAFTGTPGLEQFFIEKEGAVAVRQVLGFPRTKGELRFPVFPAVMGLLVILAAVVAGVVFAARSGGGVEDGIEGAASANLPPAPNIPTLMAPLGSEGLTATAGGARGLWRGVTISGRVTDADTGLPLANVSVTAENNEEEGPNAETNTGANGRYTIRGVAPGEYRIRTQADNSSYISQFYDDKLNEDTADFVTINGLAPVVGIDLGLKVGATISGTVTDESTGLPIARIDVHAGPLDRLELSWTSTDTNGQYVTRGLPNGVMEVLVGGQTYIEERRVVTISRAKEATGVDIVLKTGATISGTVTDEETGLPIAGLEVHAARLDSGQQFSWTMTDAAGYYTATGLPGGVIEVFVEGQTYVKERRVVTISAAAEVEGVDITLKKGATISGTVTDGETGLPIAGMEVHAGPEGRGQLSWTETDRNGKYTTQGLPNGVMVVTVEGQGYIEQRKTVIILEGVDVTAVDF